MRLRFGAMTLPHQLVRVLLAEQIYRAPRSCRAIPIIAAPAIGTGLTAETVCRPGAMSRPRPIAARTAVLPAQSDCLTMTRASNRIFDARRPAVLRASTDARLRRGRGVAGRCCSRARLQAARRRPPQPAAAARTGSAKDATRLRAAAARPARRRSSIARTPIAAEARRPTSMRSADDRAQLKQALIDTTRRFDAAGAKIDEGQQRLDTLTGSEEAIRNSLDVAPRGAWRNSRRPSAHGPRRAAGAAGAARRSSGGGPHVDPARRGRAGNARRGRGARPTTCASSSTCATSIAAERDRLRDDQKALED